MSPFMLLDSSSPPLAKLTTLEEAIVHPFASVLDSVHTFFPRSTCSNFRSNDPVYGDDATRRDAPFTFATLYELCCMRTGFRGKQ